MSDSGDCGEVCQRCGETGEDRRTLRMGCFYAMEELGLPLGAEVLLDADPATLTKTRDASGITLPGGASIALTPPTLACSGDLWPVKLYTLRVCKGCRTSWLEAIASWFREVPQARPSPGTGIYVRRHGEAVEVSLEEWHALEQERPQ